jgi:hypothetical protein
MQVANSSDFDIWNLVTCENGSAYNGLAMLPNWVNSSAQAIWAPDVNELVCFQDEDMYKRSHTKLG